MLVRVAQTFATPSVSLGGASPLSPTIFVELKPQQTGTRLLIGYGEVATTSGSTNSLPGRLISRTSPFEGERGGASPSPAAIFPSSIRARRIQVWEIVAGGVRRKPQVQRPFRRPGGDQPLREQLARDLLSGAR